jgi:hypothetical protein
MVCAGRQAPLPCLLGLLVACAYYLSWFTSLVQSRSKIAGLSSIVGARSRRRASLGTIGERHVHCARLKLRCRHAALLTQPAVVQILRPDPGQPQHRHHLSPVVHLVGQQLPGNAAGRCAGALRRHEGALSRPVLNSPKELSTAAHMHLRKSRLTGRNVDDYPNSALASGA